MIGALAVVMMVLAGAAGGAGVFAVLNRRERSAEQMAEGIEPSPKQMADADSFAWVSGCGRSDPQVAEQLTGAGEASPRGEPGWPVDRDEGQLIADNRPPSARVLIGPRLDTGTEVVFERSSWPAWIEQAKPGPAQIGDRWVVIERPTQGPDAGELVIRAPGQTRLVIRESSATASPGRRALDTLGGFAGWAREWLPRIHGWLTGEHDGPRELDELEQAGWTVTAPDIAAEVLGLPLSLLDADPRCWTTKAQPVPRANAGGELHSLGIGDKRRDPLSLYVYRKDEHIERMVEGGEALLERWRQAGWDGRAPVMRAEVRARGEALRLRLRGDADGEAEVDLSRLTHCADATKLARFWAYAVGRPGTKSGHFRLVVPATTASGAERPARKCEVDERWRVVQAAAGEVPDESLAQCRERKRAAREAWHVRARQDVVRRLAEDVALDGIEDADAAREIARERVGGWLDAGGWRPAFGRARAATQDLVERERGAPVRATTRDDGVAEPDELELESHDDADAAADANPEHCTAAHALEAAATQEPREPPPGTDFARARRVGDGRQGGGDNPHPCGTGRAQSSIQDPALAREHPAGVSLARARAGPVIGPHE